MNANLQHILDTLQQIENLSDEQKSDITKSLKDADKELSITNDIVKAHGGSLDITSFLSEKTIFTITLNK